MSFKSYFMKCMKQTLFVVIANSVKWDVHQKNFKFKDYECSEVQHCGSDKYESLFL